MMKKAYDVIVVGCGPGGAIAGKYAALSGAHTLIVEMKRQIGFPVYDSMAIIYSQSEMEEVTGEEIEPGFIYGPAEGFAYVAPSGTRAEPQSLPDGIYVNRQLFEKSLAIAAVRAGAEIMLHTRAIDLLRDGDGVKGIIVRDGSNTYAIPCAVVIAADGSYQTMGRLAGINFSQGKTSASIGCELVGVRSPGEPHAFNEIFLDENEEKAYCFAAPYGGDRITIGTSVGRVVPKQKKSLKQGLADFMKHLEAIGRYDFSTASPVNLISGGGTTSVPDKLASDGIILIGNGAGGPMWGSRWGGKGVMLGACWTGRVGAGVAVEALQKRNVSEATLNGRYMQIISDSLQDDNGGTAEATDMWRQVFMLSPQVQEAAVREVGKELSQLHLYARGALPLRTCLPTLRYWLMKNNRV